MAGCKESPFELGWADGNWTRAAFAVKGTAVELTFVPPSTEDASAVPTEARYAWEGYPQCVLCAWQPDFAGLISNDISEVLLAVTCACVFLGAIFVPDQRRASEEVPDQARADG